MRAFKSIASQLLSKAPTLALSWCCLVSLSIQAASISDRQQVEVQKIARQITVRILSTDASGSGAIVSHQGQTYKVLTNWHVVDDRQPYTIIAPDGRRYQSSLPLQLKDNDLALITFSSPNRYAVAQISPRPIAVGELVFASGFPMYENDTARTTFARGLASWKFTSGKVSLLPPKSLPGGYSLGYTNDIVVGMSGGPILSARGLLVGINGRLKYSDPAFGGYNFADGTQPDATLLDVMVSASWGIPIHTYVRIATP